MMHLRVVSAAVLAIVVGLGRAQTTKEWTINAGQYGLAKTNCVWYPGRVGFLDDDHLVISAPVAYSCDKNSRGKPTETRITVIDLQGHQLASIHRADVIEMVPGPVGYVTVCTGDKIEMLSPGLQVATTIAIPEKAPPISCYFNRLLSPSRTAMVLPVPADSRYRLYHGSSNKPIADVITSQKQSVSAATDDGFLVCGQENKRCEVVGPGGVVQSFALPGFGYYVIGLLTPDRLLVGDFNGKRLYAETPVGEEVAIADVAKIRPPFINTADTEMSAVEPRRILYRIDGCLLGDFDDCYGVVFRRFAVFDSQTSQLLFRHNYASDADVKISPNGHIVMEQAGENIHLFRIP